LNPSRTPPEAPRRDDVLVHGRRRRPVAERVSAERAGDGTRQPSTDTTGPTAPGNLAAFDIDGCETWLLWAEPVDDFDPEYAILYEVHVNGVFDGAQLDTDRWVTCGTESSNTFTVQAIR
jgi:hypothetical protein